MKTLKQWMDEGNIVGSGAIAGLGYNSGTPNGTPTNYESDNIASADAASDILKAAIQKYHINLHAKTASKGNK